MASTSLPTDVATTDENGSGSGAIGGTGGPAPIHELDPLKDPRWAELVNRHPLASVFHTPQWLAAIQQTYKYRPVVLTTTAPGEPLENGVLFCDVDSWLTGRRMVSIPFSDHCDALVSCQEELGPILASVQARCDKNQLKYVELRPSGADATGQDAFPLLEQYYLHTIDLRPELETIFSNFQKSSIQRKIKKAEREDLIYEEGRSSALVDKFYSLMVLTRQKHGLPPQPIEWFRNLASAMGPNMKIRVVSKNDRPSASILTLTFKDTMVYKYGCSDPETSNLGGTPFLFWKAILDAKELGLQQMDLGRSEPANEGLVTFKERLGGVRSTMTYIRYPQKHQKRTGVSPWQSLAQGVFARSPKFVQVAVGRFLYPHIG